MTVGANGAATQDRAPVRRAMSVDVEDYFQVWAFSGVIDRKSWDGFPLRVDRSVGRILDLLDAAGARATFFTLGWIAERAPNLIREIAGRGHEIASHGYDHRKVFEQTQAAFRDDVRKTKALLEDIAGAPVTGYRAAGFSLDARTPWAHEVLAETGHRYSSSVHPIAHDHYGDPAAPRDAFRPLGETDFWEAPVATADVLGRRVSCAGGGWFRALPLAATKRLLARAEATLEGPVIFYIHPWEIDPDQPRIRSAPLKSRLRHYLNLADTEKKLVRLLAENRWTTVNDALRTTAPPGRA